MRSHFGFSAIILLLGITPASILGAFAQIATVKSDHGLAGSGWLSHLNSKPSQLQEQFATYWTAEPGWHTDLQLRNNMANQTLTVTPVIRSADGSEISLPTVTLQPNEVESLDLNGLLTAHAPQLIGAYGSLVLRYIHLS